MTRCMHPCLFAVVVIALSANAVPAAGAWLPGNDSRVGNYGRFAGWPIFGEGVRYYEQDLLFKVYPDGIERSHAALDAATWQVGFGWAEDGDDLTKIREQRATYPASDITTLSVTWTSKEFAV